MTAPLGLAQRPDDQRRMVARDAVVLLFPGHRILGQEGEASLDRGADLGRLGASFLGRGRGGNEGHRKDDERSHVANSWHAGPGTGARTKASVRSVQSTRTPGFR